VNAARGCTGPWTDAPRVRRSIKTAPSQNDTSYTLQPHTIHTHEGHEPIRNTKAARARRREDGRMAGIIELFQVP